MIVKIQQTKLFTMKKFLVFASACFVSAALSAQNPAVKSSPKPVKSTSSQAVKPAVPVKSQPVQMEAVKPVNPEVIQSNPTISNEPQKQTPVKQVPKQAKRSKLDANKNLKSVKKEAYQTAPETKKSK
jgi:hypothetical protein